MRKMICLISLLVLLVLLIPATECRAAEMQAQDIGTYLLVKEAKGISVSTIFDKNQIDTHRIGADAYITLAHEEGIGSLYLFFDLEYGIYTVTNEDTGDTVELGQNDFLHDFVDLVELFGTAPKSVTLRFPQDTGLLNELYVFTQGQVPQWVQKWELPVENETDLVLFSTHGDDEQLFFAGILPYYAGELDYQVEVVYLTNHRNRGTRRCHEMLNGLWTVGVKTYPVFGPFGDYKAPDKQKAYDLYRYMGESEDEMLAFVVENLRRFKPKVAIGHDIINGEYGHGVHILYAELLTKALEISNDPKQYPESAEKYGLWDVPKTYLHLYPENPIIMDWDQPLSKFDGMTAYEVTKNLGFPCHVSQVNGFLWYMSGADTAEEVPLYSPREYGLYRSTVGSDDEKNDFFENVTTYEEDKRLAEEAARLAEEEARLALEREKQEQQEKLEAEAAEKQKQEEESQVQLEEDSALKDRKMLLFGGIGAVIGLLVVVLLVLIKKKK